MSKKICPILNACNAALKAGNPNAPDQSCTGEGHKTCVQLAWYNNVMKSVKK